MFDKKILKSASFNFPLICIGNLALGGTGKTPMAEYIIGVLSKQYKTAIVSRGYRRKTKGYILANDQTTALEIGDEPMQIHLKFPHIPVAVGEERLVAIPQLLHDRPDTEVVVLDDAFQHRSIRAGLNIMLTDFGNLYIRDHILPFGDLRDVKSSAERAHIIIVTKCPPDLSQAQKVSILKELKPLAHQLVFFTCIEYGIPYHIFNRQTVQIHASMEVLLVCAIANPDPLKQYLNASVKTYDMLPFRDHHIFSIDDMLEIREHFQKMGEAEKLILTTEKDAVRLQKFKQELQELPIFALPIKHRFLFDAGNQFDLFLNDFVRANAHIPTN
jgi:tetraacyldisaccharide 4'-kinase